LNGKNMKNIAVIFPGQGSQYVGMAKDLYDAYPQVKELYQKANKILGYDLTQVSFEGPEETLVQTIYTQPAIFVHSLAVWNLISARKQNSPSFVAGHSLGEYSALVVADVFSFEDGLFAVKHRATLMQEACDKNKGTMAAIIGLSREDVLEICREASSKGVVQPANFNSKEQIAISGEMEAVKFGVELAQKKGAKRAMLLQVGGAFHSPLMNSAKEGMSEVLSKVKINPARIPVISNVCAKPMNGPQEIKDALTQQITKPVLWYDSMEYIYQQGIRNFLEVGPGKVLQGIIKRSFSDASNFGVDKLTDLNKFLELV
jgi:[acyl-carrier-protein] S-malonyltransferase